MVWSAYRGMRRAGWLPRPRWRHGGWAQSLRARRGRPRCRRWTLRGCRRSACAGGASRRRAGRPETARARRGTCRPSGPAPPSRRAPLVEISWVASRAGGISAMQRHNRPESKAASRDPCLLPWGSMKANPRFGGAGVVVRCEWSTAQRTAQLARERKEEWAR